MLFEIFLIYLTIQNSGSKLICPHPLIHMPEEHRKTLDLIVKLVHCEKTVFNSKILQKTADKFTVCKEGWNDSKILTLEEKRKNLINYMESYVFFRPKEVVLIYELLGQVRKFCPFSQYSIIKLFCPKTLNYPKEPIFTGSSECDIQFSLYEPLVCFIDGQNYYNSTKFPTHSTFSWNLKIIIITLFYSLFLLILLGLAIFYIYRFREESSKLAQNKNNKGSDTENPKDGTTTIKGNSINEPKDNTPSEKPKEDTPTVIPEEDPSNIKPNDEPPPTEKPNDEPPPTEKPKDEPPPTEKPKDEPPTEKPKDNSSNESCEKKLSFNAFENQKKEDISSKLQPENFYESENLKSGSLDEKQDDDSSNVKGKEFNGKKILSNASSSDKPDVFLKCDDQIDCPLRFVMNKFNSNRNQIYQNLKIQKIDDLSNIILKNNSQTGQQKEFFLGNYEKCSQENIIETNQKSLFFDDGFPSDISRSKAILLDEVQNEKFLMTQNSKNSEAYTNYDASFEEVNMEDYENILYSPRINTLRNIQKFPSSESHDTMEQTYYSKTVGGGNASYLERFNNNFQNIIMA